jgi:hypothetical protein
MRFQGVFGATWQVRVRRHVGVGFVGSSFVHRIINGAAAKNVPFFAGNNFPKSTGKAGYFFA